VLHAAEAAVLRAARVGVKFPGDVTIRVRELGRVGGGFDGGSRPKAGGEQAEGGQEIAGRIGRLIGFGEIARRIGRRIGLGWIGRRIGLSEIVEQIDQRRWLDGRIGREDGARENES